MGNMERHLGTAASITFLHQLRDLWKSPRGTVLRIEALTVVAIIVTFLLATFGSCHRWSNRWIVQKGFFAAQVLSLSLGTYSIGLMQSSSVKSEMYPIWTVSLFTLFGCVDPVTTYNGLDYKGPLSKVVYGICLNCGYVLLMSVSTISNGVGSIAICMLSAITFIKGFHRSLSLVQQSRMRDMVQILKDGCGDTYVLRNRGGLMRVVDFPTNINGTISEDNVNLGDIESVILRENKDDLWSCYDVCVAFCLSHKLQRRFLGLSYRETELETLEGIDYKWALKVIEIELGFLYEVFFTGNAFLHYYQAKTASLWALASFVGIFFVGVAAAAIPGIMTIGHRTTSGPGGCTNILDPTAADLVISFVILVSLALLQLMHLIRCWTSNWARVAIACAYARDRNKRFRSYLEQDKTPYWIRCWMRLKLSVATSTNWFDKYLWQEKLSQYSMLIEGRLTFLVTEKGIGWRLRRKSMVIDLLYRLCDRLFKMLGLDYVWEVLWDLLGSDSSKRAAIRLDDDVKKSIIDFLGQINTDRLDGNWLSFPNNYPFFGRYLPYFKNPLFRADSDGFRYASLVMIWHTATWYCELAMQEQAKQDSLNKAEKCREKAAEKTRGKIDGNRNRRLANALSKYCTYLVVSAPELLRGSAAETKRAYNRFMESTKKVLKKDLCDDDDDPKHLGAMSYPKIWENQIAFDGAFHFSMELLKLLFGDDILFLDVRVHSDIWEILAQKIIASVLIHSSTLFCPCY